MILVISGETVRTRAKNTQRSVRWFFFFFEYKDVVVLEILISRNGQDDMQLGEETKRQESKHFLKSE
jgi:hypothetical protein